MLFPHAASCTRKIEIVEIALTHIRLTQLTRTHTLNFCLRILTRLKVLLTQPFDMSNPLCKQSTEVLNAAHLNPCPSQIGKHVPHYHKHPQQQTSSTSRSLISFTTQFNRFRLLSSRWLKLTVTRCWESEWLGPTTVPSTPSRTTTWPPTRKSPQERDEHITAFQNKWHTEKSEIVLLLLDVCPKVPGVAPNISWRCVCFNVGSI